MFNKVLPSLIVTAGEVMGEEEDPQHLYEGFFVGKPATRTAGAPSQGTCTLKTSCSPGVTKKCARGKLAPAKAAPHSPLLKAQLGGDLQGKLVRNCFGGTECLETSRAAASQVEWQRNGISL